MKAPSPPKANLIGYARVSTEDQATGMCRKHSVSEFQLILP